MMMDSAQRHGEFVANFEPQSSRLREAHMVHMRGLAPTDHAGNVFQVLRRPDPLYICDRERALVDFEHAVRSLARWVFRSPLSPASGTRARAHAFRCPTGPCAISEVSCLSTGGWWPLKLGGNGW